MHQSADCREPVAVEPSCHAAARSGALAIEGLRGSGRQRLQPGETIWVEAALHRHLCRDPKTCTHVGDWGSTFTRSLRLSIAATQPCAASKRSSPRKRPAAAFMVASVGHHVMGRQAVAGAAWRSRWGRGRGVTLDAAGAEAGSTCSSAHDRDPRPQRQGDRACRLRPHSAGQWGARPRRCRSRVFRAGWWPPPA